ncbi:MAG: cation transporter [Gammaproteobacteria bacterium]|nr:cation transporter [Gammaproteobacteria bacterium]
MGKGHSHAIPTTTKERPLIYALILTGLFMFAEIIGGVLTGSLALISDAAHMLTDVTALIIALMAIKIGRRPADASRTFGYYRFEILAAAFNTMMLFVVAIYILYEAYIRFSKPPEIHSQGMLIIATLGLIVNLISMKLLTAGKDKSLNIKGAYLEVWSDMLGSLGVILGAIIIQVSGWTFVDSIIAVLIGLWVLPRSWILLKESVNILLEGVPEGIDLPKLSAAICSIAGVLNIHELHVWGITSERISLTAHVVVNEKYDGAQVVQQMREMLATEFSITHTTLQYERKICMDEDNFCSLASQH